jgi:hypothetical protein
MLVKEFVEKFKNDKVMNNKIAPNAVSDYLKKELEVKTYLPFRMKREIAEMVVAQNTEWVDGIKRNDSINQYIGFIVAMIGAHTSLEFGDDPVVDYDLLAESGLLPQIIAEFQESYNECDILLKMALAAELEDNNINVSVARFLDGILKKLDDVGEVLKGAMGNLDLKEILGANFNNEDLANLKGFLDRYNK